jgi:hypothetical protein
VRRTLPDRDMRQPPAPRGANTRKRAALPAIPGAVILKLASDLPYAGPIAHPEMPLVRDADPTRPGRAAPGHRTC